MKTIIVIPTRWGSTRFPGKFLTPILGRPMVVHMAERALAVKQASLVVVASDDQRILDAVIEANLLPEDDNQLRLRTMVTAYKHETGTDRMAEVADRTALKADLYVNLQSDEPLICPEDIDRLIFAMDEGSNIFVGTLAHPISRDEADDPNIVKVVTNNWGDAMYFSRSPIPYHKGISTLGCFRHLGVYAYRAEALLEFASLPRGAAERAESLEQLRWLEKGGSIYVLKVDSCGPAVDTPEGARMVEKILTTRTQVQETYTRVFLEQSAALSYMATFNQSEFNRAVELIVTAARRVILTGIGKSGIIAHKIAATLSSIGIPSLFVHPAEAKHGDLGMIGRDDVVIVISQTGGTAETLWLTETLKNFGVKIIAITGNANSVIGELADVVLKTPVDQESIPGIPAPSVSTTLALVMGDALAAAVAQVKGVTAEDFARLHPANQR